MAITLKIKANRRNAIELLPTHTIIRPQLGHFQAAPGDPFAPDKLWNKHHPPPRQGTRVHVIRTPGVQAKG